MPTNRHKFDARARKCAFLGYKECMKGVILLGIVNHEIIISKKVKFFYLEFRYHDISHDLMPTQIYLDYFYNQKPVKPASLNWPIPSNNFEHEPDEVNQTVIDNVSDHTIIEPDYVEHIDVSKSMPDYQNFPLTISSQPNTIKFTRTIQPLSHLKDYACNSNSNISCQYPIQNYILHSQISPNHQAYIMSLSCETKPTNYQVESRDPRWAKAMETEIDALNKKHTWEFVDMPIDASFIGSKWVYKIKRHTDGSIERFKACSVGQGFNQNDGLDYFETFSPVAKISSLEFYLI